MSISAFAAWFEGFCDACGGALNAEQVRAVREKLAALDQVPSIQIWQHQSLAHESRLRLPSDIVVRKRDVPSADCRPVSDWRLV